MFKLVYGDKSGNVYDDPAIEAIAFDGKNFCECNSQNMIPLPEGAILNLMPGRMASAKNGKKRGKHSFSVSAILPNGYTRLLLPAYKTSEDAPDLPLFAYTAVAFKDDKFYVGAHKTDVSEKWNPLKYNISALPGKIKQRIKKEPHNRLINHLSYCALNYKCYNAQNIFHVRWEGGIPLSSECSANCFGCISFQKNSGFPSPQNRINFTPSIGEITSIGIYHLENAKEPIISFGQGCEGEPALKGKLLLQSIKTIRDKTKQGIIHLNTNGSKPDIMKDLFSSGLDSVRISLNSAVKEHYLTYYRPAVYSFEDVITSIDMACSSSVFTSLNLLVMPGFNDREEEIEALFKFLEKHQVNMIQMRNLNFDPAIFFSFMPKARGNPKGMLYFINLLKKTFPGIRIGSINPYNIKNNIK